LLGISPSLRPNKDIGAMFSLICKLPLMFQQKLLSVYTTL
jgi:hypothetical protein